MCYAFSLPPTAFTAQVNRATAENAQDVALAEGLQPLQNWVKHLIDRVLAEEFAAPDLEFVWDQGQDADPSATATIATDYVKTGIKSINEVRAELGLPPVAGGEQPKIQTAQGLVPLTANASAVASEKLERFNPNHYGPGPQGGQFAPSGEGDDSAGGGTQVADSGQVATGAAPEQVAQAGDDTSDESGRGREDIESEFVDQAAPVRAALYNAARSKLGAIDPENTAASAFVTNPDWVPSQDDLNNMQDALDRATENAAANAAEHGYEDHVDEFPASHR